MKSFVIDGKKIVCFILYFTIIMETLIAEFKFPSFIRYINDGALILTLFFMKGKIIKSFKNKKITLILICILSYFVISLISSLINYVSPMLVIWGLRNCFRGILYFIAVIIFLNEKDLPYIFDKLLILQLINLLLALYQFIVLHHDMDSIGGIFGYGNGAGVNIFNALLIAYFLNGFLFKKIKLYKLIFVLLSSFIIAAIAEEKITYVFFVVIFGISIIFSKFSIKKVIAIVVAIMGLMFGLYLIQLYYPDMYNILVDPDMFIEYSQTTYEEGYMIPRIGAFSVISNYFFDSTKEKLFGLGMGNCDTSNFSIFQSSFYNEYGHLNYRWFTHQWIFLEEGYIGFIAFLMIFISCIYCLFSLKNKDKDNFYIITSLCVTICCIILIWYNGTLKHDASYIAYFSVAIGFISINSSKLMNEMEEIKS